MEEKLQQHAGELAEDAEDIAELIGEKDMMKTKLGAMKEMLMELISRFENFLDAAHFFVGNVWIMMVI